MDFQNQEEICTTYTKVAQSHSIVNWETAVDKDHKFSMIPMSWELPQMNGRNWKSSRPQTPWLPAGSILYVFCNLRMSVRYLKEDTTKDYEKTQVSKLLSKHGNIPNLL